MELFQNKRQLTFLALIISETLLITIFRGVLGYYITPLLLFITSLSIAIYPLHLLQKEKIGFVKKHPNPCDKTQKIILWSIFSLLTIGTFIKITFYIEAYPIDLLSSDIIPTFQRMARLYMNREYPYQTFNDYGYTLKPSYLTLHWAPFIISEYFDFDPRWMGVLSLFIGVFLLANYVIKSNSYYSTKIVFVILPFIFFFLIVKYSDILRLTIESLVMGYYLILGLILITKKENVYLLSVGILLCILSRFSLIIWLPVLFVVYFINDKKELVKLSILVLVGIIVLYVIPFLSVDYSTITNHFGKAINEWYPTASTIDNKPKAIFSSVGFSSYFYSFLSYTIPVKAKMAQYFHIIISIIAGLGCAIYYVVKGQKEINKQLYLLLSLKLCLVVFYNFIHVPYPYLNMVHVFFSLVILIAIDWKSTFTQ